MTKITSQKKDFPQWYLDVVKEADLADYSQVKGCMIIKPYGYAIWELMQAELDRRIKLAGVKNLYFPLFIPESLLNREKAHLEGFAPECAVVTHGGGKKLAEPLIVRPTSETIMYDTFADWIHSYRDLPLKVNQWANVVRWEMRTRPFLRTTEFLWQEGHTVHATSDEAAEEVERALRMYDDFDREFLALPVLTGKKSRKETFAGALYTMSTEALAKDGKVIQAGTSHHLGQTFSKSFGINFQDEKGEVKQAWQTSWGLSTRIIGTVIVCHGDEKGLVLPPNVAPYQLVLVPIYKTDDEKKKMLGKLRAIKEELEALKIRVHLDDRDNVTPGFKFNEWEVKGVPLRIDLGPRDLEKNEVVLSRRDGGDKTTVSIKTLAEKIPPLLAEIQTSLLAGAESFLKKNIYTAKDIGEMIKILDENGGFVKVPWAGSDEDERKIQEETKATIRIVDSLPLKKKMKCFYTGRETDTLVYFARAY